MNHMNQEKPVLAGVVYFKVGSVLTALGFTGRGASGLLSAALRLNSPTVFLIAFLEKKGTPSKQGASSCATPHKKKHTLVFVLRKTQSASPSVIGKADPSVGEAGQEKEPSWILDALARKEAYLNN